MPTEFQTLVMRAKASHIDPETGNVTLTLEQIGATAQVAGLLYCLVVERAEVQVVVDREVKP